MPEYKIIGEVNQIIENFNTQSIEIQDGLYHSPSKTIRMIEFYSNSKYLLGQNDELGKEKPFLQVGNPICDVEDAAVDIDTKDIAATADQPQDYDKSFLLSVELYEWMKEADFGFTLNELKRTRTRYGGVLAKKCIEKEEGDKEKKLRVEACEWNNLVFDPVDIMSGAIIEKHYMSPAEVSKKDDVWDNVPEIMKLATKARKTSTHGSPGTDKASVKKIPIFEVRGEFSLGYYKQAKGLKVNEKDWNKYSYQLYIIAGEQGGGQYLAYCENDTEKIYKYLPRKRKAKRSLGVGVIEENEQAQIWTNDAVQKQQRALEYSSKVLGQSASRNLKGRNLLTEYDNGGVVEHDDGKPITTLNLQPSGGMGQFDNLVAMWYSQAEKTSSTYAAQRGETPPSGTPYRLQAAILQQSSSVFDDLREEMGIFVSEIFYDWVLPFISSRLNKEHILSHEFEADELKGLDEAYSLHMANEVAIANVLAGNLVTSEDYEQAKGDAIQGIQQSKAHRFFDIPKNYYKDLKAKITINTTGEQRNKAAALESLQNILTAVASNPAILQDPVASQIFMKIVEMSGAGISPISLVAGIQEQAKQQEMMMQQQAQAQGGQPGQLQPQELSLQASGG